MKSWRQRCKDVFFTVMMSKSQGMTPLGLLIAGPIVDAYGVQLWYLVGTVGILAMSVTIFLNPAMMKLEDHQFDQSRISETFSG